MAKCLNCSKDVESKGTKPRRYCSDACRMAFKRKAKLETNTATNEQVEPNTMATSKDVHYHIGDKTFKTRQESDAEFTRLMATADRDQPNKKVSKPGDADYPAQSGTKKCWCCGSDLEWDVLVCCGPCAWSGAAKRAREAGYGPGNPVPKAEPAEVIE